MALAICILSVFGIALIIVGVLGEHEQHRAEMDDISRKIDALLARRGNK